jgi:hypothetical protein
MLSQYSRLSEAYEGDDDPACASSGGGYDDTKPVRKSGKIHANAVLHYVRIMVEISILIVVLTILGIQWKHASTSSPVISTMPECMLLLVGRNSCNEEILTES